MRPLVMHHEHERTTIIPAVGQPVESLIGDNVCDIADFLFPTLGALFWRRVSGTAAFWSTVGGGSVTVWLTVADAPLTLDPVFYGLGLSAAILLVLTLAIPDRTRGA